MAGNAPRTSSRSPSGNTASTTTKTKPEGTALPVVNPLDLWYLCERLSMPNAIRTGGRKTTDQCTSALSRPWYALTTSFSSTNFPTAAKSAST